MSVRRRKWLVRAITVCMVGGLVSGIAYAEEEGTGTVTVKNGPITFTATQDFFDTKYHLNANGDSTKPLEVLPKDGFIVGSIGATRPNSIVNVNGEGAKIGFDDGKDNDHAHMSYMNMEGATVREEKEGDISVIDPVAVVAINGGTINIKGEDMRFNVIYGYVNHGRNEGNPRSKIDVTLTGDLIGGDDNYPLGSRQEDYYKQAKPIHKGDRDSGGWFGVGTIDAYTLTDVSVKAKSIKADNLIAGIGANLNVTSDTTLVGKRMWASNFGKATLLGKDITLDAVSVDNPLPTSLPWEELTDHNTVVTIGDDNTNSVTITNSSVVKGGLSALNLKGNTITMGAWEFDGGKNGREDSEGESKSYFKTLSSQHKMEKQPNPDSFTAKAKEFNVTGHIHVGFTNAEVNADTMNLTLDNTEIWPKSNVTMKAKTVNATMGGITLGRIIKAGISDPISGGDVPTDTTLTIVGDTGSFNAGHVSIGHASPTLSVTGGMDITMKSLSSVGGKPGNWNNVIYHAKTDIEGKTITFSDVATLPNNDGLLKVKGDNVSVVNDNAVTNLKATDSIHIHGTVFNAGKTEEDGTVTIEAPTVEAYRIQAGGMTPLKTFPQKGQETKVSKMKSRTTVTADTLTVGHSLGAFHSGNVLDITAKDVTIKGDAPRETDELGSMTNTEGALWAVKEGTINLSLKEGGTFTGKAFTEASFKEDALENIKDPSEWSGGIINLALSKDSTWNVPGDSHVTTLTSSGGSVAPTGDNKVAITMDNLAGNVTMHLRAGTEGNDSVTVANLSDDGAIALSVLPDSTVKADTTFNKVKLLTVTNLTDTSKVTVNPITSDNKLYGLKAPVVKEGTDTFLDGSFAVDTENPNEMLVAGGKDAVDTLSYGTSLILPKSVLPLNDSATHKGVWANLSRVSVSHGGVPGHGHELSMGASTMFSKNVELGVGITHQKVNAYGKTRMPMSATLGELHVRASLPSSTYLMGIVKGGTFHEGHVYSGGLRYGKVGKMVSPYVELGYGKVTPNHAYSLVEGVSVKAEDNHVGYIGLGMDMKNQVTDSLSMTGHVGLGRLMHNDQHYTIDDGTSTLSLTDTRKRMYWNVGLGLSWSASDSTNVSLKLATGAVGDTKEKLTASLGVTVKV